MPPGHWNYSHARERGTGIPVRPSRPGRELFGHPGRVLQRFAESRDGRTRLGVASGATLQGGSTEEERR
jgi:hypothetical protein